MLLMNTSKCGVRSWRTACGSTVTRSFAPLPSRTTIAWRSRPAHSVTIKAVAGEIQRHRAHVGRATIRAEPVARPRAVRLPPEDEQAAGAADHVLELAVPVKSQR
jgi:hypothetical protein